jgi:hypothetical protein
MLACEGKGVMFGGASALVMACCGGAGGTVRGGFVGPISSVPSRSFRVSRRARIDELLASNHDVDPAKVPSEDGGPV